jgi:hypothetical protein
MADETTNVSERTQLSIFLRYMKMEKEHYNYKVVKARNALIILGKITWFLCGVR